jgi:hypothetical protein
MRIVVWQVACLFGVIDLIWLNEMIDLQAKLFGVPPSPGEWGCASFLTIGVIFLGVIAIFPVYRLGNGMVRRSVTICSYCGRVQVNERAWEKIELFFFDRMEARLSHGVCPECGERVMRDYRCGKKNAGSREAIQSESCV